MAYDNDPLFYPPNAPVASPTPSDQAAAAAAQSAVQAASSATTAQTAATSAGNSATAAATSATNAAASAAGMAGSVAAAAASASQADTAKLAAQTAQTAAETANGTAQTAATTATTQAGLAATSKTGADTAAATATTQAGVATTQAGIATTQAANAAATAASINTALTTSNRITPYYEAIQGLDYVGRNAAYSMVDSGLYAGNNTYVFNTPIVHTGNIDGIRFLSKAGGGTVFVKRYTKSGNNFTQVGSDYPFVLTGGEQTLTANIPVNAGDYIGFYGSTILGIVAGTLDALYSAAGNIGNFTDSTTTASEVMLSLIVSYPAVTNARVTADEALIAANTTAIADQAVSLAEISNGAFSMYRPTSYTLISGVIGGNRTYVKNTPVPYKGAITGVRVYAMSAGDVFIKRYTKSGSNFTQVSQTQLTMVSGMNNFTGLNIPVNRGDYIGYYANTIVSLKSGGTLDALYSSPSTGNQANFTDATDDLIAEVQMGIDLTGMTVTPAREDAQDTTIAGLGSRVTTLEGANSTTNILSLENVELVAVNGDSYTSSRYTQRGKDWLSKVSLYSNFNFENFALESDDTAEQLAGIRAGTARYSPTLSYKDYKPSYALNFLGENDAATYSLATFIENMRQITQTQKGLGAVPIIATPWTSTGNYGVGGEIMLRDLATEVGAHFINIIESSRNMEAGTRYAGFYSGLPSVPHPNVRVNEAISAPMARFFSSLGRPRQSLKIFRRRTPFTVGTIADLMFDSMFERAERFREIFIGHKALQTASEKYYDSINVGNSNATINSEYLALRAGTSVAFTDYALIEAILPTSYKNVTSLKIGLSDPSVTVYIRDVLSATQPSTAPLGVWTQLTNDGSGKWNVPLATLKNAMLVDKLSILIYKSGGFSLNASPTIEWVGSQGKPNFPVRYYGSKAQGTQLLAKTTCETLTGWTQVGSPTVSTDATYQLTRNNTGYITVDATNKIKQTLTGFSSDDNAAREVEVEIWARRFPALFDNTGDYSTAPVTQESHDWRLMQVDFIIGSNTMPIKEKVGLWWEAVTFRTFIPTSVSTIDIQIGSATGQGELQISKVSVRQV
ncbi:hypothetical protein ELG64_09070 [Rhizobium leguminosarum]|uniref:hypothetical protein n=1 Tax=Rhizobium leguminosarum TaxID=384 RepID=UPI00103170CB|nr:hypothetical protein [Rhizobium leguminosarum]TBH23645.1 hypothetical protein ELG64_09070 [Rhizobium leguminosarum]